MAVETSIVIRTLNEAKHLEELMRGIHEQNYKDWETILVDSGSTDGSPDIASRYGARIFHIPSHEFTYGRSLNLGCQQARGRYLVFASGHVRPVTNNWLGNLIRPFQEPAVAMVYGRQRGTDANRLSEARDLDTHFGLTSTILVDEPRGNNGNAAVRRDLWEIQRFDETLPGLEDVDWARKAERMGYRVYYAADAAVYHVHEETLPQVYRRHYREAVAAKRMFPHFRFTMTDLLRGLPYFLMRDFLYAFRHGKKGKVFQAPGTRLAQFLGIYKGCRYQKRQSRQVAQGLQVPPAYDRVIIEGPGKHGLRRATTPEPGADEVLVQVAFVGVSPMDPEIAGGRWNGHGAEGEGFPLVPGRHYAGIVVKRGAKAAHLQRGQKVVGDFPVGCGRCDSCAGGDLYQYLCHNRGKPGLDGTRGAYAHYLVKPASWLHKLPIELPLQYGPFVEPSAVCLEGLQKLHAQPGGRACVVGAGPMGNLCAQILLSWNLRVTVVDADPNRLSLLRRYDLDTLAQPGELAKYQYLIDATGHGRELSRFMGQMTDFTRALFFLQPYPGPVRVAVDSGSNHPHLFYSSAATRRSSWDQAIRMILRGQVRLDDHAVTVEPLGNYIQAWEGLARGGKFTATLRSGRGLEGF